MKQLTNGVKMDIILKTRKIFYMVMNSVSCWMQNKAWRELDAIRRKERHR